MVWSDWATVPKIESESGIRLDATYYYWPGAWVQNRPGMFTGSGMPMRFADIDGSVIDCYQLPTHMTDESGISYGPFAAALLNKALGPEGCHRRSPPSYEGPPLLGALSHFPPDAAFWPRRARC